MLHIIIGNIIALVASILMVCAGYLKQKKKILYVQTIQIGLFVISNVILGGITGAISNVLGFIRNILCYKDKLGLKVKIIFVFLLITLGLSFNNLGIVGLLPVICAVVYILLMNTKNIINFKLLIIITMFMWGIYDIYIKSYTSAVFDFMNIVANIISIVQIKLKKKKERKVLENNVL